MHIDRIRRQLLLGALAGTLPWLPAAALAQGLLEDLAVAVANDRADEVRRLLARGMDPDSVDANGETMLCIAARSGSVRATQLLLEAKAKPDKPNRWNAEGEPTIYVSSDPGLALLESGRHPSDLEDGLRLFTMELHIRRRSTCATDAFGRHSRSRMTTTGSLTES